MFFNRFRVEHEGNMHFVQFGLIVAGELIDNFACVIPEVVLNEHKKTLLGYISRFGAEVKEQDRISWKGYAPARSSSVVDIINMSYRGQMAEISLHGFSMHGATVMSRATNPTPTPLDSECLAILRSESFLQKQVIAALYENAE